MGILVDHRQAFLDDLEEQFEMLPKDSASHLRQQAWERFQLIGLPSNKTEAFQHYPLSKLYSNSFEEADSITLPKEKVERYILAESQNSCIVFVNGAFSQELSQLDDLEGSCVVCDFDVAMRSYGSFLQARMGLSIKREQDPFALMNIALHSKAAFLYVPAHMKVKTPIQVLHIITGNIGPQAVFPRMQVYLGQSAKATLSASTVSVLKESYLCSGTCDIALEKDASCHFEEVVMDCRKGWHFSALRGELKEKAFFRAVRISDGSESVRFDDSIELIGPEANSELCALGTLKGAHMHNHVLVEHKAPNCHSSQLFKNVLKENTLDSFSKIPTKATSSFEGKIYVHSEAQKTDAFQLSNNLILDERSTAYAKPNLEIFADDVKASHGATTAELDLEALFYLRSRGINEKKARSLLVQAFCSEVLEKLQLGSSKDQLYEVLRAYDN